MMTIFSAKWLLTNTPVSRLPEAFANGSSADIKLLKTQLHKIGPSGGFLGRLLGPLLKTGLPLIRNVFKPLAESVLIPLGLINLDEYQSIGTHWIALYVNGNNRGASYDAIHFDSFEVEHIPKEI